MKQQSQADILLQKFRPMIRERAHKMSRQYGLEYEDMEAQGLFIFTRAFRDWDPARASFSTYLWHALDALSDYARTQYRRGACEDVDEWETIPGTTDNDFHRVSRDSIGDFIDHLQWAEAQTLLSQDAQELYGYIEGHDWYDLAKPTKRITLAALNGSFREGHGWSKARLQRAWAELRRAWHDPVAFVGGNLIPA